MNDKDKNHNDNEMRLNVSPLRLAAMQLHEMYTELRAVGFSRSEALTLVSRMMTGDTGE